MPIGEKLRTWARCVKRDGVTLWFAGKNPMTPWYAKALGALVVAYALSPIDLIPDFIPVLGYLDDVLLLPVLIWLAVKLLPAEVLQDCRRQAEEWMQKKEKKPISRAGVAFVIAMWLVISGWIYMSVHNLF
ncbi:YkvA family protein [Limnohabitans sp.]|uniref:YkvA family protein n=1 Tax=Limnohabitans sp. TaxID=1907725 RepID=UPI0038BB8340